MTIMVLELKVPHATDWSALGPLVPVFASYALSFVFLGIYWNNHHHMMHTADTVNGRILWANLHLLFWLSLVPFGTAWMGENHLAPIPTAAYGLLLALAGVAYYVLSTEIIAHQGPNSKLKAAVGKDRKGIISVVIYIVAIPFAFVHTGISVALYVAVALDMARSRPQDRIENTLNP